MDNSDNNNNTPLAPASSSSKKNSKKKKDAFKELPPFVPSGTLLSVSENVIDNICCFIVPSVSMDPKRFLKSRDLKYASIIYLQPGDLVYYLGTYKNLINKKQAIYHRFLFENKIVYVFDESVFSDLSECFTIKTE